MDEQIMGLYFIYLINISYPFLILEHNYIYIIQYCTLEIEFQLCRVVVGCRNIENKNDFFIFTLRL